MQHSSSLPAPPATRQPVRPARIRQLAKAFRRHTPVYLNCTRTRGALLAHERGMSCHDDDDGSTIPAGKRERPVACLHRHCQQASQTQREHVYRNRTYYRLGWDLLGIVPDMAPDHRDNTGNPSLESIHATSRSLIEIMEAAEQTDCLRRPPKHPSYVMASHNHPVATPSRSMMDLLRDIEAFVARDLDPLAETSGHVA